MFNKQDLDNVFTMIQQDGHDVVLAVDASAAIEGIRHAEIQLTYSEYVEGLAAIAVYRDPDPYKPLAVKMEMFLKQELLRFGKKKRK